MPAHLQALNRSVFPLLLAFARQIVIPRRPRFGDHCAVGTVIFLSLSPEHEVEKLAIVGLGGLGVG